MAGTLILVDYENVQKFDISRLDDSYRGVIFVGANQHPPRAAKDKATAHRFCRVDFHPIEGSGRNALDFHIAFHLGRTFETAKDTVCIVLSKDKGYDPLLLHLNKNGMDCRRVSSLDELLAPSEPASITASEAAREPDLAPASILTTVSISIDPEQTVCRRCKKASTIEHHGGRWCSNCGTFASPPDPKLLPSLQLGHQDRRHRPDPFRELLERERHAASLPECGWCHQHTDMTGGIYDDGEWMCGGCIARYAR
ncbi:PIN domain-containing protein [Variovorax sp. LjRoot130]|uniref:PIN domain-containing protein n=1 Tax=Variovorax sp. LjRoot130 TaxID=3342261 RepID=UPI003ECEC5AE